MPTFALLMMLVSAKSSVILKPIPKPGVDSLPSISVDIILLKTPASDSPSSPVISILTKPSAK